MQTAKLVARREGREIREKTEHVGPGLEMHALKSGKGDPSPK